MMKETLTAFLLTSVFATSMLAQRQGGPRDPATMIQRRVNLLTTVLSLTNNQQTQASTIFTAAAASNMVVRNNLQNARQSLADAVKNNDTAMIDQLSTTIGNLTAQQTSSDAKANAAFYQMLTPDQQTKLNEIKRQRPGMFGGMGPGGPGPGPAGRRPPPQQ
jgi:Spy/CpxP family protein refolding chaperone